VPGWRCGSTMASAAGFAASRRCCGKPCGQCGAGRAFATATDCVQVAFLA
jgi:hypothetical protein